MFYSNQVATRSLKNILGFPFFKVSSGTFLVHLSRFNPSFLIFWTTFRHRRTSIFRGLFLILWSSSLDYQNVSVKNCYGLRAEVERW